MKIIQIVGKSNSGKTTFIKCLIPELKKTGSVAVIKHLGHHIFNIEEGKDTSVFFESGADISVGIDDQKSVAITRKNTLDEALLTLHDQDVDFVIIEGFKQRLFPKIVIGDLETDNCILANPLVKDVIASLDMFDNFIIKK
jgi:molybdopterin-guanine dinucleotide biosynthesis protein MobB